MLVFNIPTARYTELFMGYHRLLKSGGCLELVESDLQLQPAGPVSARLNAMLRLACRARGVDLDYATNLDEALRDLGKAAVAVGAVASESEYEQMLDTFWAECEEHRTIIYGYYFYGQRPQ